MTRRDNHIETAPGLNRGTANSNFQRYVNEHNAASTAAKRAETKQQKLTPLGVAIGRKAIFGDPAAYEFIDSFHPTRQPAAFYLYNSDPTNPQARAVFSRWRYLSNAARIGKVVETILPETDPLQTEIMNFSVGNFVVSDVLFKPHKNTTQALHKTRVSVVLEGQNLPIISAERALVDTAFGPDTGESNTSSITPDNNIVCRVGLLINATPEAINTSTAAVYEQFRGTNVTLGPVDILSRN